MLPGLTRTDAALAAGVDLPPFSVRFDIVVVPLNGASRFGLGRGLGYVSETDAVFLGYWRQIFPRLQKYVLVFTFGYRSTELVLLPACL